MVSPKAAIVHLGFRDTVLRARLATSPFGTQQQFFGP
jgi:hypothetical protein